MEPVELSTTETTALPVGQDPAQLDSTSQPYVGRWNTLVSTTNWEKGRVIHEWRSAMIAADVAVREYSDEAWTRRVGAVTGQHVGRLRRVYERFGLVCQEYPNLYWSHFHAALDWDDAEMWLEGAVQSGWSVSQMRRQRWQAMGAIEADKPQDKDNVVAETDEDVSALGSDRISGRLAEVQGPPIPEGPDFGDESESAAGSRGDGGASIDSEDPTGETVPTVRPFENLAKLPDDVTEAFEGFKLVVLRHKSQGWEDVSREDMLAVLDALKELALAPSTE